MMAPGLNIELSVSYFERFTENEICDLHSEVYQHNLQENQNIQNYLKANNEDYRDIVISNDNLDQYPPNGGYVEGIRTFTESSESADLSKLTENFNIGRNF